MGFSLEIQAWFNIHNSKQCHSQYRQPKEENSYEYLYRCRV